MRWQVLFYSFSCWNKQKILEILNIKTGIFPLEYINLIIYYLVVQNDFWNFPNFVFPSLPIHLKGTCMENSWKTQLLFH